ncbi:MAG: glycosyltransferase, partial [Verrucomicrobia bacterium]|nr:glycosyltransferase [Verrucomicrobiota bacterium]
MKLSIIIPAHNEEKRIGAMLDAYLPYFAQRYGSDVELLVVVNGTTDDTEGVVQQFAACYPQLRMVVEPKNIGKGGGVILGFEQAKGDLIGYVDADGSTPPQALFDLIEHVGSAPVVIASRWCRGATVDPPQPFIRRLAS